MYRSLQRLREFRVRTRVVYALIGVSALCALGSAFLLPGQLGVVSFVAFLNFTAGLAIAQAVHAVGHAAAGRPAPSAEERPARERPGLEDVTREQFVRVAVVVAAAATVFVFTASEVLPPEVSVVAIGAIGAIALLTAMLGFFATVASTLDHEGGETRTAENVARSDDPPRKEAAEANEDR